MTYCKTPIHHPDSLPLHFLLLFKKKGGMDDAYCEPTPFPTVETTDGTGCDCSAFTVSPLPAFILFFFKEGIVNSMHQTNILYFLILIMN